MDVGVADPDRVGVKELIPGIVDRLVVLVQRAEESVSGEKVRVTLRFRSATDVALAGEALRTRVGEIVADDARRERAQVCLL
jgi:hypothetical protein